LALALPSYSRTRLEKVSKGKPSSILGLVVSDEGKKFNKIDTRRRKVPRMKQISEILRIPAPTPETVDLETGNGDD
jgi:hypothetical protein